MGRNVVLGLLLALLQKIKTLAQHIQPIFAFFPVLHGLSDLFKTANDNVVLAGTLFGIELTDWLHTDVFIFHFQEVRITTAVRNLDLIPTQRRHQNLSALWTTFELILLPALTTNHMRAFEDLELYLSLILNANRTVVMCMLNISRNRAAVGSFGLPILFEGFRLDPNLSVFIVSAKSRGINLGNRDRWNIHRHHFPHQVVVLHTKRPIVQNHTERNSICYCMCVSCHSDNR